MVSVAEFGASNAIVLLCKLELWVLLNILERMQGQAAHMAIQQSRAPHGSASWHRVMGESLLFHVNFIG